MGGRAAAARRPRVAACGSHVTSTVWQQAGGGRCALGSRCGKNFSRYKPSSSVLVIAYRLVSSHNVVSSQLRLDRVEVPRLLRDLLLPFRAMIDSQ